MLAGVLALLTLVILSFRFLRVRGSILSNKTSLPSPHLGIFALGRSAKPAALNSACSLSPKHGPSRLRQHCCG